MQKIFTVYDSKAAAYLNPFYCPTTAVAQRSFTQAALDEQHDFNRFSKDYTLWELGYWNPEGGTISLLENKINLGTAHEHIANATNTKGRR